VTGLSSIASDDFDQYLLIGISLCLFFAGCFFLYLSVTGRLKKRGRPISEVRKEALEKIKSETYLAKLAKEDPDPQVRLKARRLLENNL
jgi:hypothetical protein